MVDVRCPMCGNLNPADSEVCRFCQARIKPLIVSPVPEEPEADYQTIEPDHASEPTTNIPDWLISLRAQDLSSTAEEIEPSLTSGVQEEPQANTQDWLEGLRSENTLEERLEDNDSEPFLSESNIGPSTHEAEAPDWLANLRAGSERYIKPLPTTPEPEPPKDWLETTLPDQPLAAEKQPTKVAPSESQINKITTADENRVPAEAIDLTEDDLSTGAIITGAEKPLADESIEIESEELPEWLAGIHTKDNEKHPTSLLDDEVPDWLSKFKGQEQPEINVTYPISEPVKEVFPPLSDRVDKAPVSVSEDKEDDIPVPDFLKDAIPPFTLDKENLLGDEIQDWVDIAPVQEIVEKSTPTSEVEQRLEEAQLPVWLEGLRQTGSDSPIRTLIDEKDKHIESAGPLVGMQGALPAEPDVARQKKTSTYSAKLLATEKQQANAAIIEEMIKSSSEPAELPNRPVVAPLHMFRIAVFIILVMAILLPIGLKISKSPFPQITPETYEVSQIVNHVAPNSPVLLGVDYEPGLSGEMEAVSSIIIDHLMVKGAYLVLVSTIPTGPFQAERLINLTNTNGGHKYVQGKEYTNLGYIPGGQSGLLALAQATRQIFPYDMGGNIAWENQQLQNVQKPSDFSLVMVLTDNPDTARTWIEQVGPSLGNTPLLMAVSAQAEPFVRPYFAANPKQVNGMVAGLAGGTSYEKLMPHPGLSSLYWDSYSLGALAAAGLIFISGLVNMVFFFITHKNRFRLE